MHRAAAKLMVTTINRQSSLKQWFTSCTVMLLTTINISGCGGASPPTPSSINDCCQPQAGTDAATPLFGGFAAPGDVAKASSDCTATSRIGEDFDPAFLRSESPLQMAPPLLTRSG